MRSIIIGLNGLLLFSPALLAQEEFVTSSCGGPPLEIVIPGSGYSSYAQVFPPGCCYSRYALVFPPGFGYSSWGPHHTHAGTRLRRALAPAVHGSATGSRSSRKEPIKFPKFTILTPHLAKSLAAARWGGLSVKSVKWGGLCLEARTRGGGGSQNRTLRWGEKERQDCQSVGGGVLGGEGCQSVGGGVLTPARQPLLSVFFVVAKKFTRKFAAPSRILGETIPEQ